MTLKNILVFLLASAVVVFVGFSVQPAAKMYATIGNEIIQDKFTAPCESKMRALYHDYIMDAIVKKLDAPRISNWNDELDRQYFCIAHERDITISSYAINKNIGNYTLKELPGNMVLFFESNLGPNGVGDIDDVLYKVWHGGAAGIIFADGRTAHLNKEQVNYLRWE